MNVDLDRCLSRTELARLLGVSTRTVRRMDRDGSGPRSIRPSPRLVRYPAAEVAEFMSAAGLSSPVELHLARNGEALPGAV